MVTEIELTVKLSTQILANRRYKISDLSTVIKNNEETYFPQ